MRRWIHWLARTDPRLLDGLLAALCLLFSLRVVHDHYPAGPRPFDLGGLLLLLIGSLSIAFRRIAPFSVLLIACATTGLSEVAGYWPALGQLPPQFAFATLAALRPRPLVLLGSVVLAPIMIYSNLNTWPNAAFDVVVMTLIWIAVLWAFGDGVRRLGEQNRQLAARNERLAHLTALLDQEHRERASRALLEERVRIARELHDIVAHHVAVMAVQAELAGYVFTSDPETARRSLVTVAGTGRVALSEMYHLLSALRPEPGVPGVPEAGPHPPPGLSGVSELAARVEAAGVPVRVIVIGTPRALPQGLDLCAYRVIQESLTNVVKHAREATATVRIDYRPACLDVLITDSGKAAEGTAGHGHGLLGMAERAKIYEGTLMAGPRPDGGFQVQLTLPLPLTEGTPLSLAVS
ncbi:sensor histidine kinase [Nonomuraea sp. NPDC050328]|uniref:sensor histidine kinase n=1 Tax=Nonomuraea sp. NPDC050328 TaxID=3364361 RepID=UPI0037ACB28A